MITTTDLLNIGQVLWMGEEEHVDITEPEGDHLPPEWSAKIGTHHLPAPFAVMLDDVELLGPALVGLHKRDVILDTAYFGRLDLWERNYNYFTAAGACMRNAVEEYDTAISFGNVWSSNYFHFLIDTLPKLEIVAHTNTRPTILLGHAPPPYVAQYLHDQGLPYEVVTSLRARVRHLIVPTTRRREGVPYPSAVRFLKRMAMDITYTNPFLYISRRNATARRLVNEDELLDTLLPAGFSPLVLENMDVSQQRLYFSGADVVVSPHGAGLANIVFGNPRVIECVCPSYTNPCAWLLGVVAGCDYRFHVGNKANREDIMVKPAFVKEMLDGLPLPTQHH